MFLDEIVFKVLCAIFVTFLCILFAYFKYEYKYWDRKGVPYSEPSFPFGNIKKVVVRQQNMGERIKEVYDEMKDLGHKYAGLFTFSRKMLLVIDPELIKNILTRDFDYFNDRGLHYDEIYDPISAHLFSLHGEKWRKLRAKLTPTFTSGKLKFMFHNFVNCAEEMVDVLEKNLDHPVEMKDVLARFTTDVIGTCAFGIDCNSLKDPDTEFRRVGKRAFTQTVGDAFRIALIRSFPKLATLLNLGIFPHFVTRFFQKVVEDTIKYRNENQITRKDFLQLLIELMKNGKTPEKLSITLNEAIAQAFIFFVAGFETTATTICFAVFEMAINTEVQDLARQEVIKVLEEREVLDYDSVMEMHYLERVVLETLRKYPPAPIYLRKCCKDYVIPGTGVIIPEGLSVLIPALGVQRDKEYYPEPDSFDPERFREGNRAKIKDYTYIPFGEGPRICIGQRFAILQTKVALALLLKKFTYTLNQKTSLPLKMEKKGIITTPMNGIWINLTKLS